MLRLAFSAKWLVRAGLGVLLIIGFIFLGRWQWDRTQGVLAAERAALAQQVAVDELNPVGRPIVSETVGRAVSARGQYLTDQQRFVVHRSLNGKSGVWVVTPLQLGDGSRIAVMRGWLPSAKAPGVMAPTGEVDITGVLQADESFYKESPPDGSNVAAISRQSLQLGATARDGFIRLSTQTPLTNPAPVPVPAVAQQGSAPFPLQNFFYAIQWWIFSLFVVGVYLRWLWLDAHDISHSRLNSEARLDSEAPLDGEVG